MQLTIKRLFVDNRKGENFQFFYRLGNLCSGLCNVDIRGISSDIRGISSETTASLISTLAEILNLQVNESNNREYYMIRGRVVSARVEIW